MRQPNFDRSEYNTNVEETFDDSAEERLQIENREHRSGIDQAVDKKVMIDDRISYDSSHDNDKVSSSCTAKSGFGKIVNAGTYQEDLSIPRPQFDSLKQDSSKVNFIQSNVFGSRQLSLGQSKQEFGGRIESCEVEIGQPEESNAYVSIGDDVQNEPNRYFIKKGVLHNHRDFANLPQEETTRRQITNYPVCANNSRMNDQTKYINIGKEEENSDKTYEKYINNKNSSKNSSMYRPTMRQPQVRKADFKVPGNDSNTKTQNEYIDADTSQMMYSSKYITNPFKESIQERPTSNRMHKASKRESKQNSVHGYQSGSKFLIDKLPQFKLNIEGMQHSQIRDYKSRYLDHDDHHHSNSYLSGNSLTVTPKHGNHPAMNKATPANNSSMAAITRDRKQAINATHQNRPPTGLTRKDVVDILKLHTKLQAKIRKLEASTYK